MCSCCADKVVQQELAFGFKDFGCLFNGENFTFPGEKKERKNEYAVGVG